MPAPKPLMICETLLRDAHQSLLATRMRTEDMLPFCAALDEVGYWSLEVWGGATFDTAIRFLGEDPWERLRALRRAMPKTRLQMLLRGQNVVGYKHYPDDILEKFIVLARRNGIDVFRIFDALNDLRNMETAMRVAKREGGHVQGTISYTISPVHTDAAFVQMGRDLKALGADSIAVKDMAGMIGPYTAYSLVKALKEEVGLPVQLHTHSRPPRRAWTWWTAPSRPWPCPPPSRPPRPWWPPSRAIRGTPGWTWRTWPTSPAGWAKFARSTPASRPGWPRWT